jgi:acyl carrier protein
MFASTTLDEFNLGLRPKVQGSWNLHTSLPSNLDFFIMLSSFAGIVGSLSQSNYNCGNVFQDALARYRVERGQRGVSLDLGMVQSVGFVAENADVAARMTKQGYGALKEAELLALLDYWCNPTHPLPSPEEAQVVTGVASWEELKTAGVSHPFWLDRPLFSLVRNTYQGEDARAYHNNHGTNNNTATAAAAAELRALLQVATTREEADDVACQGLVGMISRTLGVPVTDIDTSKPAFTYGVDSLGAVEVRHWLGKEMGADVPTVRILSAESIRELARGVVEGSVFVEPDVKGAQ